MKPAPSDPPEIEAVLWKGIIGNTAWYVGANTGQSLFQLRTRFNHIIAFEPAEECWAFIEEDGQAQLMKMAISSVNGDIQLAAPPSKISTGQLVTPGTKGMEWDPDEDGTEIRNVPARTIDFLVEILPPPSFILVDVEGHEGHVLHGAQFAIAAYQPSWLIEFHTPELHEMIEDFLIERGYTTETVRHPHYAKGSPMWFQHGWLRAFA